MKTALTLLCFLVIGIVPSFAQQEKAIERELKIMQSKQDSLGKDLRLLRNQISGDRKKIQSLINNTDSLHTQIVNLKNIIGELKSRQNADRDSVNYKIESTNTVIAYNQSTLENRTLWGGIIVILIVLLSSGILLYLFKRIKSDTNSIDEVRKAQDTLQNAQTKMQEESINLDNKLLTIIGQQMNTPTATNNQVTTTVDHSLALKVTDEIVRIELNLSRMDSSIKGYKQLAKAVQRIKDNFHANGYEIVDMLGKPYNEGMKVTANFISDETLEQGKQIITGIIKPQINYNGKMIQSAQITVSQNI